MGQPVVHFEIIGNDPAKLRRYYGDLFGWEFDTSGPVHAEVSEAGNYGFVDGSASGGRARPAALVGPASLRAVLA